MVPQQMWEIDENESLCEMMLELYFMGSTYFGCYKAKSKLKNNPINAFFPYFSAGYYHPLDSVSVLWDHRMWSVC